MKFVLIFLAGAAFTFSNFAHADQLSEERIKELILETIRKNPEIIRDAITQLQQQDEQKQAGQIKSILADKRELIERDPNAPVLGNPNGGVTVVEFSIITTPTANAPPMTSKHL